VSDRGPVSCGNDDAEDLTTEPAGATESDEGNCRDPPGRPGSTSRPVWGPTDHQGCRGRPWMPPGAL